MKRALFFLFAALSIQLANAQSVGIGTTTPNAKAALEISSTTKGLLIPSMTSLQRGLISAPPNGLMVYDTDVNQFYHYDGTSWRKIINSTYWNQSTTRNWVYNSTDSVGIGTSIPAHRLDVNGNIRSRDDILADGKVTATGIVSGSSLQTAGNLVANGTSFLTGDVSTNGDIKMNGTGATLQLTPGGVNKGYFQTAGNDVRMGTNSGNASGNLIIRMNGNDRVQINPSGDIDLDGKITKNSVTGSANLLPRCYGYVASNGTIISGSGNFSVFRDPAYPGEYEIICNGFGNNTVLVTSLVDGNKNISGAWYSSLSKMYIVVSNLGNTQHVDGAFHFIAY